MRVMHSSVRPWETNLQAIVKVVHFNTTSSFGEHSDVSTLELPLRNPLSLFRWDFHFTLSIFFFYIIARIPRLCSVGGGADSTYKGKCF